MRCTREILDTLGRFQTFHASFLGILRLGCVTKIESCWIEFPQFSRGDFNPNLRALGKIKYLQFEILLCKGHMERNFFFTYEVKKIIL